MGERNVRRRFGSGVHVGFVTPAADSSAAGRGSDGAVVSDGEQNPKRVGAGAAPASFAAAQLALRVTHEA